MQKEILEKLLQRQIISHLGWFQKRPHPPSHLKIIWMLICIFSIGDEDSINESTNEAYNDLPLSLGDATTVGEIVKIYDANTAIVKLAKIDQHAFLDISR